MTVSYVDLENATPENVVAHFVLECRGGGAFLPYSDHQIVTEWLVASNGDLDELLVVLSEALPAYFSGADAAAKKRPRSLVGIRKIVQLRLEDRRGRRRGESG